MLDRVWLDREMAPDPQMYQSNTDLTCYGFIFVATDLIHVCLAGEFPVKVKYVIGVSNTTAIAGMKGFGFTDWALVPGGVLWMARFCAWIGLWMAARRKMM